ncbi:MAG: hypothetical protein KAT77_03945 [Nanoarchaeota archaeon]|nr:hypothetical protein [Nanoarchaeota archaeon]
MKFFLFLFLLFLVLCTSFSSAILFSKLEEKGSYVFEPNLQIIHRYYIGGGEGDSNFGMVVDVYGPQNLDQYILIEPEVLTESGVIKVNISLPEKIEGGNYFFVSCAKMFSKEEASSIGVSGQICSKFSLLATFPGKNLKFDSFSVENVDINAQQTPIRFSVSNWGKEKIESLYGEFDVFDIGEKKISSVTTFTIDLDSTKTKEVSANLSVRGFSPGQYKVKGTISWDEGTEDLGEKEFSLGSAAFKILNITKEFYVGEVNDLFIMVKNDFGATKNNIYLNIEVAGQSMDLPPFNMEPFSMKTLKTFLDARTMEIGVYEAKVIIFVDGSVTEDTFLFEVKKKPISMTPFYVGGGLILIVLFILSVFVMLKKRGKRNEKAQIL